MLWKAARATMSSVCAAALANMHSGSVAKRNSQAQDPYSAATLVSCLSLLHTYLCFVLFNGKAETAFQGLLVNLDF